MENRTDCLVVPSDSPPSALDIKRQLLFFDSVTLVHPNDKALVNDGEIREKFSQLEITWSERNPFPRNPGYEDAFDDLVAQTGSLASRQIVRVLGPATSADPDPGMNWVLWNSLIAQPSLVEAAVPERSANTSPPTDAIAGYMSGMLITQGNEKSKYECQCGPAHMIPGVPELWSLLAHIRIGRAGKFVRRAYGANLVPLALDPINDALLNEAATISSPQPAAGEEALVTISHSLFDAGDLNNNLSNMSWNEVARLRREVLPGVANLRNFLMKEVNAARAKSGDNVHLLTECLEKVKHDYETKKLALADELEKLRIATVLKGGGAAGAGPAGLLSLFPPTGWIDLWIKLASVGLVATATLSSELKSYLPARRKVREHPLFFMDRVPK